MNKANADQVSKNYPSLFSIRYGFKGEKSSFFQGVATYIRACAHNPFGVSDRFNEKLYDRELEYSVKLFKKDKDLQRNDLSKPINKLYGQQPVILSLRMLDEKLLIQLNHFSDKVLGILAETCHNNYEGQNKELLTEILTHFSKIYADVDKVFVNKKCFDVKSIEIFTAEIIRDTIRDLKNQGVQEVKMEKITSILAEKTKLKIDEIFPRINFESRTQGLLNVAKSEFLFNIELFVLEIAFSVFSSDLMFSLTKSFGIASFAISLFFVMATLPYMVSLMESTWKQFASYGTEDGPKTLKEVIENIRKHMQESWEKTVYSDKSFHPIIDALLNTFAIIATWCPLASYYKVNSHAIYYLVIDIYFNIKSSLLTGKDPKTAMRDFVVSCIAGITRGLIKDIQKISMFMDVQGSLSPLFRSYYDAIISYSSAIAGEIIRTVLSQLLSFGMVSSQVPDDGSKIN